MLFGWRAMRTRVLLLVRSARRKSAPRLRQARRHQRARPHREGLEDSERPPAGFGATGASRRPERAFAGRASRRAAHRTGSLGRVPSYLRDRLRRPRQRCRQVVDSSHHRQIGRDGSGERARVFRGGWRHDCLASNVCLRTKLANFWGGNVLFRASQAALMALSRLPILKSWGSTLAVARTKSANSPA